ncbi:ABC transporter permease [Devosia sp. CN2-171]|uniref:ABC transporter permease n=1 Tax=Devosia sp. CN2-171 TaxID=3400909 RepID=UPI003BF7822C
MRGLAAAIRIGLLDMRGDWRRFGLLISCLFLGTALLAGVSSVGATIRQAVDENAALLMGGDIEMSRTDRPAADDEIAALETFGRVASVVDTNVRASTPERDAFADLVSVGPGYPLLGQISGSAMPPDVSAFDLLALQDGAFGALVSPLMLDQLGIGVGDVIILGGTQFVVRGTLTGLPDNVVRGFRLGLPAMISTDALAVLSDRTSPLPGLGTFFRYKVLLAGGDKEAVRNAMEERFGSSGWTVRSARDGLGPMVRYYDMFMQFLAIVGLASLLIGGVSVWTSISAYIAERSNVIAVLRSLGATSGRVLVHFAVQIALLTAIGVGLGLLVGGGFALVATPIVGQIIGVGLPQGVHVGPLAMAAGIGCIIAFVFSYLPLQQAETIRPVALFRSKGVGTPPIDWRALFRPAVIVPMVLAIAAFLVLASLMTNAPVLVGAFAVVSVVAATLFRMAIVAARGILSRLPEPRNRLVRAALRGISATGSNATSVVVSLGMALSMLVIVLVLQLNLSNEYLGASAFDAPTLVASDLFEDEVATLETLQGQDSPLASFTVTPMLRGSLASVNDTPASQLRQRGSEAGFLLSGEIPLTYRQVLPPTSKLVEGRWWEDQYAGPPLVSVHESLRAGLGLRLGDRLTFDIFGDQLVAEIRNFREYSWQGGIDFLVTFSPGVLEGYPSTLLAAVNAKPGQEDELERQLGSALPDVRFIAIGETLKLITMALSQLSLAASLVGGLAVANGLLVLLGSLGAGQQQRRADVVINKVLGATHPEIVAVIMLQFALIAAFAAVLSVIFGTAVAWLLTQVLLDVEFSISLPTIGAVELGAVLLTALLGAASIYRSLSTRAARLLREMV